MDVTLLPERRRSRRSLVDGNTLACKWAERFSRLMAIKRKPPAGVSGTSRGGGRTHRGRRNDACSGGSLRLAKLSRQLFEFVEARVLMLLLCQFAQSRVRNAGFLGDVVPLAAPRLQPA